MPKQKGRGRRVKSIVKALGGEGLVGLIALWILWGIYDKK